MSDQALDQIRAAAEPKLRELADKLQADFVAEVSEFVDNAKTDKLKELLKTATDFRLKALTASTPEEARQYAEATETALRRIKTVALAERIVAEEHTAALISKAAKLVLNTLVSVGKEILGVAVQAAVSGAVQGLAGGSGGGGFDPSKIFRGQ